MLCTGCDAFDGVMVVTTWPCYHVGDMSWSHGMTMLLLVSHVK